MKKMAVLGTGAYAVQVVDHILASGVYEFVGYIGENGFSGNEFVKREELVCFNEDVFDKYKQGVFDCVFIGIGYANKRIKTKLYSLVKGRIPLGNIIHPTAVLFPQVELGEGILIGAYSIVGRCSKIHDNVSIVNAVSVGHDANIGSHSYIASRAALAGRVSVGELAFIGVNASIREDVVIGDNATVGIGSVVLQNIPDNTVWAGNPALFLKNQ